MQQLSKNNYNIKKESIDSNNKLKEENEHLHKEINNLNSKINSLTEEKKNLVFKLNLNKYKKITINYKNNNQSLENSEFKVNNRTKSKYYRKETMENKQINNITNENKSEIFFFSDKMN